MKAKRFPWITLFVSILSIAVPFGGTALIETLQWRTDLFATQEYWRLATGHFVHWSWDHLTWDVAMFALLGCLIECRSRKLLSWVLCITIGLTDPLLRLTGSFEVYRGLSGIALGLFVYGSGIVCVGGIIRKDWVQFSIGVIAILLVVAKIGFEILSDSTLFADTSSGEYSVSLEAHLAGIVAGFVSLVLAIRAGAHKSLVCV